MHTISRAAAVIATAAFAFTAACSGAAEEGATSSASATSSAAAQRPASTVVPDADSLTLSLVQEENLGTSWRHLGLSDKTPFRRSLDLPCAGLLAPQWQVGTKFFLANEETENLYAKPMLEEYLLAADPEELEQMYLTLRQALDSCAAEINGGYNLESLEVLDLGETGMAAAARVAQALRVHFRETTIDQTGGALVFDKRLVLARSGATLMMLGVFEIKEVPKRHASSYDPFVTNTDLDSIVATAFDKLP